MLYIYVDIFIGNKQKKIAIVSFGIQDSRVAPIILHGPWQLLIFFLFNCLVLSMAHTHITQNGLENHKDNKNI